MVGRGYGVTNWLDDIMLDNIPDFLILRGTEGVSVSLRDFLKLLNVFHGDKASVLCDDTIEERGNRVKRDVIRVDWTRIHCRYSAKHTVTDSDI